MNRNQVILLLLAILSFPLVWVFVPGSEPGSISSLEGVTLANLSGQKFRLAGQFVDKPLLLVFWSITCGNCIDEIPFLARLHEELKNQMTIIGIHPPSHTAARIVRFAKKYRQPIPYMIAIDEQSSLIRTYDITILPRILLVNRQGRVLYDHLGYDPDNEKEIELAIKSQL